MSSASSAVTYTSIYTDSEPGRPVAPPSPDYIPDPEKPQTPPVPQDEDEHVFPAEEQPLPPVDSPTAESPGYVTESDPEEDPEEYKDDESEDGSVDYPKDEGDDRDDDDGDSSGDNVDDEDADEDEEDKEDKEEHVAPADSAIVVPTDELVSPPEGIEPNIPPPSTDISTTRAKITVQLQASISLLPEAEGISEVGYGIRDTWVDPTEAVPEISPMTMGEVNARVTKLIELHEHDTQDLYALLEDAQDGRTRISQRVAMDSHRVDLLIGDRMNLQETVWMVEDEAYASREAWSHSIGLSQATHQELQTHRDHVYAHETHIQAHQTQLQLHGTLIQTQHQMAETLRVMRDMRREMSDMQTKLLAHREQQRRARQLGPYARIPDHQDASGDADSYV
ncbi:hypothetical protein Tco_0276766 [Tanacetum coccineum]